ncbi:MAG: GTPase Era [Proteobacteria bacterium]|nr:GTPase Era [Pseudomonadota bacterium]
MQLENARAGRCAIMGRPNVGKSTLLNAVLGQKLVIATPKAQTTRTSVLGVYVREEPPTQIAFVDTPGLHRPKDALDRVLAQQAKSALTDADAVLWLSEVNRNPDPGRIASDLEQVPALVVRRPVVLAINKVDRVRDKRKLLPVIDACRRRHRFAAIVPVSARSGDNLDVLVSELRALLPQGLLYPQDVLTDKPQRFFVAELVREAVLNSTRHEVPHSVAVVIDKYLERGNLVRISATLYVERASHKAIVIGVRGQQLKRIGIAARKEIEALLERRAFVRLWVKVARHWRRDPASVRRLAGEPAA